jgi:short-subunit dehydrogenase
MRKPVNPKIKQWQGLHVWLVGASSGIGAALASALADRGAILALSARRVEKLEALRATLGRSAAAHLCLPLDVTDLGSLEKTTQTLAQTWQKIDLVIWLAGDYSPMTSDSFDFNAALKITEVNYVALLKGLHSFLPQLIKQASGGLVLVSSVAGYRGLPKALAYGPSKAAVINLAEVLYLDLHDRGIGVWLVNPGFVATPLTAGNQFRMPALMQAEDAAKAIIEGLASGLFELHFPKRFTSWLKLARILPYALYFRLIKRFVHD